MQAPDTSYSATLFDRCTAVAREYLGPAAERFLRRQVTDHLNRQPEELSPEDIPELARWVRVSAKLLTNETVAEEFSRRIASLGR